jgi:hypothetical protein
MTDGRLNLRAMRRAIDGAREVAGWFGEHPVSTAENSWLLKKHRVVVHLEELPEKYAAMLSPLALRGMRSLSLGRHVPILSRRLVLLHEAGHLYPGTAELGITYDNAEWQSSAEQLADAFASVGLIPRFAVDLALQEHIWVRDVEDSLASQLMEWAEGIWEEPRALAAAQNRLLVRERLGT